MRILLLRVIIGVGIVACPQWLFAETVYVIDKLLVGVHAEKSLDSPIVKVFSTGTQLEVLKREGDLAQVKGPEGVTGWVDAVYLTKEQPAAIVVGMLEAQNRKLVEDLRAAQAKASELESRINQTAANNTRPHEDLEALRKDKEDLRQTLEMERTRANNLQTRLAELQNRPVVDDKVVATLRQENASLKSALTQARAMPSQAEATVNPTSESSQPGLLPSRGRAAGKEPLPAPTLFVAAALLFAASFASGAWLVDYLQRRRHGGFRI